MLESSYFPVVYSDLNSLFVLSFETVCNSFDQSYIVPKPNFLHFLNKLIFIIKISQKIYFGKLFFTSEHQFLPPAIGSS